MLSVNKFLIIAFNISFAVQIVLPLLLTQHNWPLIQIAQFFNFLFLIASGIASFIITCVKHSAQSKSLSALNLLPIACFICIFVFFEVLKPEVNVKITYKGPLPEIDIQHSTRYGSRGTKIKKDQTLSANDIEVDSFHISLRKDTTWERILMPPSGLEEHVPFIGGPITLHVSISGNTYKASPHLPVGLNRVAGGN